MIACARIAWFGITAVLCIPSSTAAQATIRAALLQHGFAAAIDASGPPLLDEVVDGSEFISNDDTFVAAYHFERDLKALDYSLRVSAYHSKTRAWLHASALPHSGGVLGARIAGPYLIVPTRISPSANLEHILDAATLRVLGSLFGFDTQLLPDGTILFSGGMRHFAPTHQERLLIFDPRTSRETELFPGKNESPIASGYRRLVRQSYGRLPADVKAKHERSADGPIDDFDRQFTRITVRPDGRRIAFVTFYGSNRLRGAIASETTIVRCDHRADRTWSCEERAPADIARTLGIDLKPNADGKYEDVQVDTLLRTILAARVKR